MQIADREDGIATNGCSETGAAAGLAKELEAEIRELRRRAEQLEQENDILRRATAYFARDVLPQRCTRRSSTSPTTRSLPR